MTGTEITEKLQLNKLKDPRVYLVQPSCATAGDGLQEGPSARHAPPSDVHRKDRGIEIERRMCNDESGAP